MCVCVVCVRVRMRVGSQCQLHVPENEMTIRSAMEGQGARGDGYSVHLRLRGPHRCSHKGGTAMSTVDEDT